MKYIEEEDLIVGRTYSCEMYDGIERDLRYIGDGEFAISLEGYVRYAIKDLTRQAQDDYMKAEFGDRC